MFSPSALRPNQEDPLRRGASVIEALAMLLPAEREKTQEKTRESRNRNEYQRGRRLTLQVRRDPAAAAAAAAAVEQPAWSRVHCAQVARRWRAPEVNDHRREAVRAPVPMKVTADTADGSGQRIRWTAIVCGKERQDSLRRRAAEDDRRDAKQKTQKRKTANAETQPCTRTDRGQGARAEAREAADAVSARAAAAELGAHPHDESCGPSRGTVIDE